MRFFGEIHALTFAHLAQGRVTDQGVWLGDDEVGEIGEARKGGAGRRVGEQGHVGEAAIGELLVGDGEAGQLHEGEQALAHARPGGRHHGHDRLTAAGGALESPRQALAAGHADGPTEEAEVEGGDDHLATVEGAGAGEGGFGQPRAALRLQHAVPVGLSLAEVDRSSAVTLRSVSRKVP